MDDILFGTQRPIISLYGEYIYSGSSQNSTTETTTDDKVHFGMCKYGVWSIQMK